MQRTFIVLALLAGLTSLLACGGESPATRVTINGREMFVNGTRFQMRGVVYSPVPSGETLERWSFPDQASFFDRDFEYLQSMNCNTIRTLLPVNSALLDSARRHGLLVICAFPVDPTQHDFSLPAERAAIKDAFRAYVAEFKNHPAVLMWCLGNEVNRATASSYWYSLLDECAAVAHAEEGEYFHPVSTANFEIQEIGSTVIHTTDADLPNVDLWCVNAFRGASFGTLFTNFALRSLKPLCVSAFGTDAYDALPGHLIVDETTQAQVAVSLWNELDANFATCVGGCLMEFSDEWWRAGNPSTHDTASTSLPSSVFPPDNTLNPEFWGMFDITPHSGAQQSRTARQIYHALSQEWRP